MNTTTRRPSHLAPVRRRLPGMGQSQMHKRKGQKRTHNLFAKMRIVIQIVHFAQKRIPNEVANHTWRVLRCHSEMYINSLQSSSPSPTRCPTIQDSSYRNWSRRCSTRRFPVSSAESGYASPSVFRKLRATLAMVLLAELAYPRQPCLPRLAARGLSNPTCCHRVTQKSRVHVESKSVPALHASAGASLPLSTARSTQSFHCWSPRNSAVSGTMSSGIRQLRSACCFVACSSTGLQPSHFRSSSSNPTATDRCLSMRVPRGHHSFPASITSRCAPLPSPVVGALR